MTFVYVIIAYIAGIGTVVSILFAQGFTKQMEKEIEETSPEPEYPQAVQFIDPISPEEQLKNIDVNKLEIHD